MKEKQKPEELRPPYPRFECELYKLRENLDSVVTRCGEAGITLAGVVKGVYARREIVELYEQSGVSFLATSRVEQLRFMRVVCWAKKPLMLIRVPMLSELPAVIALSDVSLQSDLTVLRAADREAARQGKKHGVILMLDLGDLREGFWHESELVETALTVERELHELRLLGVAVNLSCYGSVKPTTEKMDALLRAARAVEDAIARPLDYVGGGSSTSMYMVLDGTMPKGINLLRIGEFALLGGRCSDCPAAFTHKDVFTLKAEVIECRDKPSYPVGELTVDAFGRVRQYEDRGVRRRALLGIGRLDYGEPCDLMPRLPGVEVLGASSDHTILDVEAVRDQIHVGDVLEFDVNYGAMAYLSRSPDVDFVCLP
ncbi:MAG: alanine/ornithine racemase family PLP-dependent enzyme [Ruminococcaceae bacterium]|nr:alanine/ornithine racemase family PLP-dependent enzyme [Oscillospiraceae bacterium]